MSKEKNGKPKQDKKAPLKTLLEKRADKKAKRIARGRDELSKPD